MNPKDPNLSEGHNPGPSQQNEEGDKSKKEKLSSMAIDENTERPAKCEKDCAMDLHPVIFEVFEWWRCKSRAGNHATLNKRKMEVSGRKPWRQKGTGRARAGGFDSPIWVGGAVAHGPQPRDYSYQIPRKKLVLARRLILKELLSRMNAWTDSEGSVCNVVQFDNPPVLQKPSTKTFLTWLDEVARGNYLSFVKKKRKHPKTVLIMLKGEISDTIRLSCRNIPNLSLIPVESLSAVNLIDARFVLFSPQSVDYARKRFLDERVSVGVAQ